MSALEAWLDVMPGETRAAVARDGRFERLIIHRDDDVPAWRWGATVVGRVTRVEPSLGGAFVDVGAGPPLAFLPLKRADRLTEGARLQAVVVAEPRGGKGPVIRRTGPADGAPGLLSPGPDALALLSRWAPGVAPATDADAIQAVMEAEEDALAQVALFSEQGVDLAVQRTRAMIAVDVDYAGARGRDPRRDRARANVFALNQAARMIRLKAWGGLVSVDLAGAGHDGEALTQAARRAFAAEEEASVGPITRFGVLQLSLPWTRAPVEERLLDTAGRPTPATRALDVARRLRHALLTDRASAVVTARCAPVDAPAAAALAAQLGPRVAVRPDPDAAPGSPVIEAS